MHNKKRKAKQKKQKITVHCEGGKNIGTGQLMLILMKTPIEESNWVCIIPKYNTKIKFTTVMAVLGCIF